MRLTIAAIALVLLALPAAPAVAEPPPEIRVLVIDAAAQVSIEGSGSALRLVHPSGRGDERVGASVRVVAGPAGLILAGADRGGKLTFTCAARRYRIGARHFRGEITVLWKESGSLMVVDRVQLEDYLAGLINSEISSSWPVESIKAQAVAARTYAMNQIEATHQAAAPRPYDITGTTLDQVYDGAHQEDDRARDAVEATRGEMLLRGGRIFPTYYHSCCGGRTERAANVWAGEEGPPLVEDAWCARSPKLLWSWRAPIKAFLATLRAAGIAVNALRGVATAALPDSPRNELLLIEDDGGLTTVRATELRRIVGYQNVKSTWFETQVRGGEIVFTGRGYGHGVGLCQWGAKGMAEAGHAYRDILAFYYPDAELAALY